MKRTTIVKEPIVTEPNLVPGGELPRNPMHAEAANLKTSEEVYRVTNFEAIGILAFRVFKLGAVAMTIYLTWPNFFTVQPMWIQHLIMAVLTRIVTPLVDYAIPSPWPAHTAFMTLLPTRFWNPNSWARKTIFSRASVLLIGFAWIAFAVYRAYWSSFLIGRPVESVQRDQL